ncbi:MAG: tetratricopeptide repeat protein [Gammaproteobacteria bacterium]
MNPAANRAPYPTRPIFLAPLLAGLLALLLLAGVMPGATAAATGDPEALLRDAEAALQVRDLYAAAGAFAAAADASPDAAVAERATQFTFGAGYDELAERAVRRWVALAPSNQLAREVLGRLELRRRAVDDAAADLLAALGPGEPRRDEVYLALASDLAAEDNVGMVTRVLARLTALDPYAPGLQLALGTSAFRSGDYELALGAAAAAAVDDPDWPEPRLLTARTLAATGRSDEALATMAASAAADPGPLVELEYARLLADAGRVDESRTRLAALSKQFGERPEIARTLAFLDLAEGDLARADQRFEDLDVESSARFEAFYYRGQIAAQRGDAEAARRYFMRISSGPLLVPAQLAIAESLARAGSAASAVEHLVSFGEDHPAQAFDVLPYRAQLLQALNRPDEALAVYGEALRYKPASVPMLLARGALLEQQGRVREGLADLKAAVALAPDDAAATNAYGYLLVNRTWHARKAWRYVRRAYEIEPGSAPIQDSVGWTLFKLHRPEEARSHLEEALARLPDPEIASHLAEVYWALGDPESGFDVLRSAAVAFPDSQPLRATVERLLD